MMRRMAVAIQPPPKPLSARRHARRTPRDRVGRPPRLAAVIEGSDRAFEDVTGPSGVERFALLTTLPVKRVRARDDLRVVVAAPRIGLLLRRGCVLVGRHCERARPPAVP